MILTFKEYDNLNSEQGQDLLDYYKVFRIKDIRNYYFCLEKNMDVEKASTRKLCVQYLVYSMLYYQFDESLISDHDFDTVCRELLTRLNNGDKVPTGLEKFITTENLEAGSGYDVRFFQLPERIKAIVHILYTQEDFSGNKINLKVWR